jgi:hypothetical protein
MKSGDVRSMYNPVHTVECLNMHMTVAVQTASVKFFLYSFGSGISVTLLLGQLSILLRSTLIVSMEKFFVHMKIFMGKMMDASLICVSCRYIELFQYFLYSWVFQVRDKLHEAGFYVEADISDRTLPKKVSLMTNLRSARVVLSLYRSNLAGCYFAFSGRF